MKRFAITLRDQAEQQGIDVFERGSRRTGGGWRAQNLAFKGSLNDVSLIVGRPYKRLSYITVPSGSSAIDDVAHIIRCWQQN